MKNIVLAFSLFLMSSSQASAYSLDEMVIIKGDLSFSAHATGACRFGAKSVKHAYDNARKIMVGEMLYGESYVCTGGFEVSAAYVTVKQITSCRSAVEADSPVTYPACTFSH